MTGFGIPVWATARQDVTPLAYITSTVYNQLHESAKYGGNPRKNMWESRSWEFLGDKMTIYRSTWQWKP